jgi:hypothetical protein
LFIEITQHYEIQNPLLPFPDDKILFPASGNFYRHQENVPIQPVEFASRKVPNDMVALFFVGTILSVTK